MKDYTEKIIEYITKNNVDKVLSIWYDCSEIRQIFPDILIATCESSLRDKSTNVYNIIYTDEVDKLPNEILKDYYIIMAYTSK